ncbi:mRNA-capping enzyme subunit alpha [Massariosphaeria phaeospora]|uniref:mRNA-capping enzyme subunit alpha n=1 Tax=Massariosphaeria phaeospora TaxID=100035 RepID=A0A7C8MUH8_9PLEO|nr:mRNA-capping enzyme subunit alpha [Massariosphaeria phaeospora]
MPPSAPPQIPGHLIANPHLLEELRHEVAELLERGNNTRFPGAQPVSFAREHISELQRNEYFMCEKTDGVRCLLFLHWRNLGNAPEPVTLLIDRKNNYYELQPPLYVPWPGDANDPNKFLFGTILDGELVHDYYVNEAKPRLIFYVFDCLACDNANVTPRPYHKRLGKLVTQVFVPYNAWLKNNQRAPRPFVLRQKDNLSSYHLSNAFTQILPNLRHGNDGLIFTCKSTPYEFGTDPHILKWKPPHENTIDFKLRLGDFPLVRDAEGVCPDYNAKPTPFQLLVLHSQNNYRPFAHDLHVTDEEWEILKSLNQRLDGRIIECYRDTSGRWRYKREDDGSPRWRDDKKDANHISTVNSVLDSIENPVTEQDLRNVEARIRDAVMQLRRVEEQQLQLQESDSKKRKLNDANLNGAH